MAYEKPLKLVAEGLPAARLKVAQHGLYTWDAKQQRYVPERAASE